MIRRWDPFREMMVLRNSVDRDADRELALAPGDWKSFNWSVALDVVESEDEYLVRASLRASIQKTWRSPLMTTG